MTLEHVVYTQVYLSNMSSSDTMDRIWREFFPKQPPARAVLGVHRMPTDTPVEINYYRNGGILQTVLRKMLR